MRRQLTYPALLALLLTVTFAGCRQEPLPEAGDAIRFSVSSPMLSVETKADLVDGTTGMQNAGKKIKVFGSYTLGSETVQFTTDLSCSSSVWNADPQKYWVQDASHAFRAVYPSQANITGGSTTDSSIPPSASSFVVEYNFLGTNTETKYYGNYDLMVATNSFASKPSDNKVPLAFQHACTAVRFLFKGDAAYYIKSFTLSGLNTAGYMTYSGTSDPAWTVTNTDDYSWPGSSAAVSTTDYTGLVDGYYFLIPQDLDATDMLSFTYTVGNADNAQVLPVTIPLKTGSVTAWSRANAYTYKINIQANAIDFTVSFDTWTQTSDTALIEP